MCEFKKQNKIEGHNSRLRLLVRVVDKEENCKETEQAFDKAFCFSSIVEKTHYQQK